MRKIPISQYYENEAKTYPNDYVDDIGLEALAAIKEKLKVEFEDWSDIAIFTLGDDIAIHGWSMSCFQTGMIVFDMFLDIATFCALYDCNVCDHIKFEHICGDDKGVEGIYKAYNNNLSLDKFEKLAKSRKDNKNEKNTNFRVL